MRLVMALVCFLLTGPAAALPSVYGFTFPTWWKDSYDQPAAQRSLEKLAATGARSVALVPTFYVKDRASSDIRRTNGTPSDDSLRRTIRRAKALGLQVVLKPHVDCECGGPRAWLSAADDRAWFESYRAFLLPYARMAAEEKVELFVVGTELAMMTRTKHRPHWVRTIAEVRALYDGKLTYAANWYDFAKVPFWDQVDFIGIDAYFPLVGIGVRSFKAAWLPMKASIRAVSLAWGKPVLFTEIGLSSQRGANLRPWEWLEFGPVDLEVQRAYFDSFLQAFSHESWYAGFLQWGWELDPDAGGLRDKSMTVQGKPAQILLEDWFKRYRGPASRAAELDEAGRRALDAAAQAPWPAPLTGAPAIR